MTTPANKIVRGRQQVFDMKKAGARFISFERNVEQVVIKGNTAISMGNETVVTSAVGDTQKISKRRYTNIWFRENGTWKLIARQASEISRP